MPPRTLHPPLLPLLRHPTPLLRYPTAFPPLLAPHILTRPASHSTERRANGPKSSPGRRLGAKKASTEFVVPSTIIFRQRGTLWFPGENCGMGRDHTIFALETGYVTYYSDPARFPGRKYIGVVFNRGEKLPRGKNAVRRRRLGMVSRPRILGGDSPNTLVAETTPTAPAPAPASATITTPAPALLPAPIPTTPPSKRGYMYRETNWSIGRTAERIALARPPLTHKERADRAAELKKQKMEALLLMDKKRKGKKGKGKKGGKGRGK